MTLDDVLAKIQILHNSKVPNNSSSNAFGVGLTKLKVIAKEIRKDHDLAVQLWDTDIHEAKLIATMIEDTKAIDDDQIESQVQQIYSWDLADKYCENILSRTDFLLDKIDQWIDSDVEMKKRMAYILISLYAKKNKSLPDSYFETHLEAIEKTIHQQQNWVCDGMYYALIAIGCRNRHLNYRSIRVAKNIGDINISTNGVDTVSLDALKVLTSEKVQKSIAR